MTRRPTRVRGELERELMQILWDSTEPLGIREIQDVFTGHIPAYTTLMTSLDRLEKKGQVIRIEEGPRKIRFRPTHPGGEHTSLAMTAALNASSDSEAALLRFAGNLSDEHLDLLRQAIGPKSAKQKTR